MPRGMSVVAGSYVGGGSKGGLGTAKQKQILFPTTANHATTQQIYLSTGKYVVVEVPKQYLAKKAGYVRR